MVQLQLEAAAAGSAESPGRRSERGESPRAAARPPLGAGLGAAQPARALLPRPLSLLPPPPPRLPLLPLCLGCSAARLALGEPQRQRRVSLSETEPGRGDTEQPPRGRQGARRTRLPSASGATAEQTPWPAEKPRRKAAGRNSSGTRRRRSFWAGPVVVGVSTRSAAFTVGALAFPRRRIPVRGHCGQFGALGAVQGIRERAGLGLASSDKCGGSPGYGSGGSWS